MIQLTLMYSPDVIPNQWIIQCSMHNSDLLFIYNRMKRIRSIFNFLESLKIKTSFQ